jgi:hypothetical protein
VRSPTLLILGTQCPTYCSEEIELDNVRLHVISRADLLHEKLRAACDPARRRSKRLQDLADAQALLESSPALVQELTPEERALLDRLAPQGGS